MSDSDDMDSRACPDCKVVEPLSEFHNDKRRKDGKAFYCKACATLRSQQSRDRRRAGPPAYRFPRGVVVAEGQKWCPDCATVKPVDEFARSRATRSGLHSSCRPCHNARGRRSLEKVGGSRTYHLKKRYGLSAQEVDALVAAQAVAARSAGRRRPSTSTTIMRPVGSVGFSASPATAAWVSSGTATTCWRWPSHTCKE